MEESDSFDLDNTEFLTTDETTGIDIERMSTNNISSAGEVGRRIKGFLRNIARKYPETGPLQVSFIGPLDEALNHSLFEPTNPRPLILYLHHSQSIAVNIFCQYVLCAETISDYLAEEFLIWTWDRTLEADYSALLSMLLRYTTKEVTTTVASFPRDAYPLLVCLSVHQSQIDVVSVIEGTTPSAETLTELLESRKKFQRRAELSHSKLVHSNVLLNENQSSLAHILKPVIECSPTIERITNDFKKSYLQIVRIEHVENPTWLSQYLEQKKIIDTRRGHDPNEQLLFHGCSRSAAEDIIQRGFDHKLIGMHGTVYGYGFYFSSDHRVSHYYSIPDQLNNGERTMLICRVLVGKTCPGNRNMRKCPLEYDSTTDGSKIFVIYSNRQILPEYLITYKDKDNTYEDEPVTYKDKDNTYEDAPVTYSTKTSAAAFCTLF